MTNFTSPFGKSFCNGVNRGVPCSQVVENICKRTGKTTKTVVNSLCKAGLCKQVKFNGNFVFFPICDVKTNKTNAKTCQTQMWQNFIDWSICNGTCNPQQLVKNCSSQKSFMSWCKKFWNKQFVTTTTKAKKTTAKKNNKKTTNKTNTTTRTRPVAKTTRKKTTRRSTTGFKFAGKRTYKRAA